MTLPTDTLITALLLLLPLAAAAPASPADRANIGQRKQLAAPPGLVRTTATPPDESPQVLDAADTTQALVCSQIFGVLPFTSFRRQRFDSFTKCYCVSSKSAVCEPDTFYPTVTPGTPEAALAQEHASTGADKFIEVLNAFSVQQTCFFEHLRGQKMSPPRPCAFSWERGSRPACDCARPPDVPAPDVPAPEDTGAEVTVAAEQAPEPAEQAQEPAPEAQEPAPEPAAEPEPEPKPEPSQEPPKATVSLVTDAPHKAAVQAVKPTTRRASESAKAGTTTTKATDESTQTMTAEAEVVDLSKLKSSGGLLEGEQRRPQVAEAYHLRRVRTAGRH